MEPKLLNRPAIKVAGYSVKTTMKDGENSRKVPRFWETYMNSGKMERLHGAAFLKSHDEYGVCLPEDPQNGEMEYLIGVEVQDGVEIPGEFRSLEIPAAAYAVFSSSPADAAGFSPAIQDTWRYIFAQWLPQSGYKIDGKGLSFEFYDERCMTGTGKVCDIYIPLCR